jgi:hypothetical protein
MLVKAQPAPKPGRKFGGAVANLGVKKAQVALEPVLFVLLYGEGAG